jgi:hypothetical protein
MNLKSNTPENVSNYAFEEWLVMKRSREQLEIFLKNAPMPIHNSGLSEKECEQYIRQVGQAIKHVNLLWKNKFLKFGRGYYKQKKLIHIWDKLEPVSLDHNFSILIPVLREVIQFALQHHKYGCIKCNRPLTNKKLNKNEYQSFQLQLQSFKKTLMNRLVAYDEKRFQKLAEVGEEKTFIPRATTEIVNEMLEKPHIIQQYFEYCGLRFNISEIKYLCLSFPSEKYKASSNLEVSSGIFKNASFNVLHFISFIDYLQQNYYDNDKKNYHPLDEQRHGEANDENGISSKKESKSKRDKKCSCNIYPGRFYWNLNDAIGISTAKILENILNRGVYIDSSLGGVGVMQNTNTNVTLKNSFIRGNGEVIRYKKIRVGRDDILNRIPAETTRYLNNEYDAKKKTSTNYNDPSMNYYPGWSWKQKRDQAASKLSKIMKQFASAVLEKHVKEKLMDLSLPRKPVLNRHLIAFDEFNTMISDENGNKDNQIENPEEVKDHNNNYYNATNNMMNDSRTLYENNHISYDNSNILCLSWKVEKNVTHYKLEQKKGSGYYTIHIDPPIEKLPHSRPHGSFKVINLKPNTSYEFRLTGCNNNGEGPFISKRFFTTPKTPPKPKVFNIVHNQLNQRKTAHVTLCWGMDLYNEWIKKLKFIFNKIRNEKKLKKYLKETAIAKKFLLHCQKIGATEVTFDMFKEFCAYQKYGGLTNVDKKKYEQLKIRLKQQKDRPDLGLGYIPSGNQSKILAGNVKGGYEVWCKAIIPRTKQALMGRHSNSKIILNKYVKVWEGLGDACTIVHLNCGYQYSFYVIQRNEYGDNSLKSQPIVVPLKDNDSLKKRKKIFPKNVSLSENLTLRIPYAPIVVSRTTTEVVVLLRQPVGVKITRLEVRKLNSTNHLQNGKIAVWEHVEGASICRIPEVPSDIMLRDGKHNSPTRKSNKIKIAPGRWNRVAESRDLCSAVLVVGLKPNASYQFRAKSVDEHYLVGPPSDNVHYENVKLSKSKDHFQRITRNNISTTFVVLVSSPKELKIGDTICFIERSRLDGHTVLAARILRKNYPSGVCVIEVIWASRLRKGIPATAFVAEKSVLGPHPFTPGYHTGSILFRSKSSFFDENKRIYRTNWIDEEGRRACSHI